jgi:uncharacterized protein YbjT (DUF2867 family)
MRKPLILVTGATGKTGSPTVRSLLAKGFPVRALARRDDVRSQSLKQAGAQVVIGSMEDPTDLRNAMSGVQRAYYCPPLEPGTLRRAALFAVVAQEQGLEVVVTMSQWLSEGHHPAIHAREKWLSDHIFSDAPKLDVITINPGFFAENYMLALEPIAHFGRMAMPLGQGTNAPPSNEDIASVVAGLLEDPAPHIGRTFRPTGPELLAPEDIAQIFGKVLGRKVKYQNAPLTLFLKVAKSMGIDDFTLEELYWFLRDYQLDSFGIGAPTSVVREIGGRPPEPFESTARRYASAGGFDRRTAASTLRAVRGLIRGLLTPAPDPHDIARAMRLPALRHSTLSAESSVWLASHK